MEEVIRACISANTFDAAVQNISHAALLYHRLCFCQSQKKLLNQTPESESDSDTRAHFRVTLPVSKKTVLIRTPESESYSDTHVRVRVTMLFARRMAFGFYGRGPADCYLYTKVMLYEETVHKGCANAHVLSSECNIIEI